LLPYAKCQTVLEAMAPFSVDGTDWAGALRNLIVSRMRAEEQIPRVVGMHRVKSGIRSCGTVAAHANLV